MTGRRAEPDGIAPGDGARAELVLRDNWRNRRTIERAYLKAIGAARRRSNALSKPLRQAESKSSLCMPLVSKIGTAPKSKSMRS